MAIYVKFNSFVEALAEGVHNLGSDTLTVALTNTAPSASTDTVLADIAEIAYTNCSARAVTVSASAQASGTYKLTCTDLTLTASGDVGPFQWVVIYNDTATNDELICYFNYGSAITLHATETLLINFDDANGLLQLA